MRATCSLFLATLLALFCYACNKSDQDAVAKDTFSYTGNNDLIATIISQLESTDFASTLQTQFPDIKADWNKSTSYETVSDGTSKVLVPVVNENDTVKNYVRIDYDGKSQRIKTVSYYNYERDYLNNSNEYEKSRTGLELKYLSRKNPLLPSTFSVDAASKFYVQQAIKRLITENKNGSNTRTKVTSSKALSAGAIVQDINCDAIVYFDFNKEIYGWRCKEPFELVLSFYVYLEIALDIAASELGGTYTIIQKNLPFFQINCSTNMIPYMEIIFNNALGLLDDNNMGGDCSNLTDEIFYMDLYCPDNGSGIRANSYN